MIVKVLTMDMGKCPRDANKMLFTFESEKLSNGVARVSLVLKCPVCNYRVVVERLEASRDKDGNILIRRFFTESKPG
uniref:Uncharacterized protein n=1 Tax=Thermosphaera aggregans TaxID=54254 RepID=A0A7C2BKD1_9CREN